MQNAEILRDLREEDISRLWQEIKRLEKLLEAKNKTIRKLRRKGIS
jgi:flagellar motility protein MotE (MotC chaperone)